MRKELVYYALSGFFITNAVLANLAGSKLIDIGPFVSTVGVLPWPIVFLSTDLINEYYGKEGVRKVTFLTVGLIIYCYLALAAMMAIPASSVSTVTDVNYNAVFGQSVWIIAGSVVAFLVSQLIDVAVFWFFRHRTGGGKLWLRATGSTAVSQLIDTFVVLGIAFWLPGAWTTENYIKVSLSNYTYKLAIALALTPIIYALHSVIDKFLGQKVAEQIVAETATHN